jgi:Domain of unknown function (DUF4136)
MKRRGISYLAVEAVLLLLASSLAAQKVTTNFSNNFDFAAHKRYAWGKNHIVTRQGRQNDALIEEKIVRDVDAVLSQKGFVEVPANPDFFISYDAGSADLVVDVEGAHAAPAPRLNEPQGPVVGIPQNVWFSVDGVIVFHFVDAKSNQTIWTSTAKKKIRDPHKGMKDMEKQVQQIISKMFKSFPPQTK